MNSLLLASTFLSNIPSGLLWVVGLIFVSYLVLKLIVKVVMKVVTIATVTIVTFLIKTGILSQFFQ